MGISLQESLDYINADVLKKISTSLKTCKSISRKAELIDCLQQYTIQNLNTLVDLLSKEEKLFLIELAHNNNSDPAAFTAKYMMNCPYPRHWGREKLSNAMLLLTTDQYRSEPAMIPDELVEPLRQILPKPAEPTIETTSEIPSELDLSGSRCVNQIEKRPIHVCEPERNVFQELKRVLSLAQSGKLRVSDKSKKPTSATVKAVNHILLIPDYNMDPPLNQIGKYTELSGPVRAYAWTNILLQAAWCKVQKGKLVLTTSGKDFLQSPQPDAFKRGVERLIHNDDIDELNRINNIRGQTGKAKRYLEPPSFRKISIAAAIEQWPINKWININEAFRFQFASDEAFEVIEDAFHLYFAEKRYGFLSGCEMEINKQYFRAFLFETLATLGLIDVAYVYPHWLWPELRHAWGRDELDFCSRYDGLLYIRLTPLGAYCLGAAKEYTPPETHEPRTLKVLPNHEIVCVGEEKTNPANLAFLELIATRQGDYNWELSKQRILDYLETGGSIDDILEFLQQQSIEPIPEPVTHFLKDIDRNTDVFGEMTEAMVIKVKDPMVATHIAHNTHTKKYCTLAGEQQLVVPQKNLRAFRTAVKKMGYILP